MARPVSTGADPGGTAGRNVWTSSPDSCAGRTRGPTPLCTKILPGEDSPGEDPAGGGDLHAHRAGLTSR